MVRRLAQLGPREARVASVGYGSTTTTERAITRHAASRSDADEAADAGAGAATAVVNLTPGRDDQKKMVGVSPDAATATDQRPRGRPQQKTTLDLGALRRRVSCVHVVTDVTRRGNARRINRYVILVRHVVISLVVVVVVHQVVADKPHHLKHPRCNTRTDGRQSLTARVANYL